MYGLRDSVLKLMRSYLEGRKQRVKCNGVFSDWLPLHCGHRWPKLPICVGNDYSGVRLHIAILSKCMGNLNSSHNVMKNNKIHCLPQASCVVVTPCVYGGFWSRLEAN